MLITIESDAIVHLISKISTSQKRINARKKIKEITSKSIMEQIKIKRELIRSLKSENEQSKRSVYAEISKLEITELEMNGGKYGF